MVRAGHAHPTALGLAESQLHPSSKIVPTTLTENCFKQRAL